MQSNGPCLVYLFEEWVLDSEVKFAFSCIGTVLMAVMIGAIAKFRRDISMKIKERMSSRTIASPMPSCCDIKGEEGFLPGTPEEGSSCCDPKGRGALALPGARSKEELDWQNYAFLAASITLFAVQAMFAYALMLVAMTYQVELFIMVFVGLTIGHTLFHLTVFTENVDPCCNC